MHDFAKQKLEKKLKGMEMIPLRRLKKCRDGLARRAQVQRCNR
jgi:hypothetical protein